MLHTYHNSTHTQIKIETTVEAPRRRRRGEKSETKKPTNNDLGVYKVDMLGIVIPYSIIYVAANAGRFNVDTKTDDPWATPTLESINNFFTKCTGIEVDFREGDPVPFIVSLSSNCHHH